MKPTNVFLFTAAIALLSSCTMQKRYHNGGWQLEFRKGPDKQAAAPTKKPQTAKTAVAEMSSPQIAMAAPADLTANNAIIETSVIVDNNATSDIQSATAEKATKNLRSKQSAPSGVIAHAAVAETLQKSDKANFQATKSQKTQTTKAHKGQASGDKNWLVALLLCWFLGVIGIHRFYLGYTVIGIIQLLTLGGFGIWTLIDFIRIIIKDLQPKDGSYIE